MTALLIKYVQTNWGKKIQCSSCSKEVSHVCKGCKTASYCGKSCQIQHWIGAHQYECIAGKKGREEEEKGGEKKKDKVRKARKRDDEDEFKVVSWNDLGRDLWKMIASFLKGEDLKNLSMVEKKLQRELRRMFLSTLRFKISVEMLEEMEFLQISKDIQHVLVSDMQMLRKVISMGAILVDIKFTDEFDDPNFNLNDQPQVTHLSFGEDFGTPLNISNLPSGLLVLNLGRSYWNEDPNNLPPTITTLRFGKYFDQPLSNLPPFLLHLDIATKFTSPITALPLALQTLRIYSPLSFFINVLPRGLKTLDIYADITVPLNNLPLSLETLIISPNRFNTPVNFLYLRNLKKLVINSGDFNLSVDGVLPESLRELHLGSHGFKQPVERLPSQLQRLSLGYGFRKSIDNLPKTLIYLKVDYNVKIPDWIRSKHNRGQLELIREK